MNAMTRFFFENAGYSYDPKRETPQQGKLRCARQLAAAERWLSEQPGHEIEWAVDDHPDRSGIDHDGPLYGCIVTLASEEQASLWGIDLGPEGDLSDPYARVVVAELASELMPQNVRS